MDPSENDGLDELYTQDTFVFYDEKKRESMELKIQQIISVDYGLYVWPSSKVLAEYIWSIRDSIKGKQVLEVGAGTSLPGLVAAACGAHVVLTDREDALHILENCSAIVHANNPVHFIRQTGSSRPTRREVFLNVTVTGLTWGKFSPKIVQLPPPDYILGADCFYDNTEVFEDLIATVAYFIKKKPSLKFLTAYQERSAQKTIKFLLLRWNLKAREIPLDSFFPSEKYKLSNVISDPQLPNCATIIFRGEDHTLGNSLRYMLMKNKNVDFAGYSIPHPSENKMNLRIQTTSKDKPAVEALKDSLRDLNSLCTHVLVTFREEVRQFKKQNSLSTVPK